MTRSVRPLGSVSTTEGALPTALVVGAMKCGTSALHTYLASHPEVSASTPKELNFLLGPDRAPAAPEDSWWRYGQWHRGVEWYAGRFDPARLVRVESSPGYTDPAHPEVAERAASLVPDARIVYLVRDPVARAVSQYRHHVRDGTETRPVEQALLDPASQYLARSRYHERIAPFLAAFPEGQLLVVVQERLRGDRRGELRRVFDHVGADPDFWHPDLAREIHLGGPAPELTPRLREELWRQVGDDVERFRDLLDDEVPEWEQPPAG